MPDYYEDAHSDLIAEMFGDLLFLTGSSGLAGALGRRYAKEDSEEKAVESAADPGVASAEECDGAGQYRAMDYQIKPWIGRTKIAGPTVTVDVPAGEGSKVAEAIHSLKEGDVLVVSGKGICSCSYWGDHRSICASMKGAAGVVIDGAFRDLEGCEEVGFPVYARALTCGTAGKNGEGAINVPVTCGGVQVNPQDLIVGDVNGVIVIRPEEADGIMERALKKRQAQERVLEEMRRTGQIITKIKVES